MAHGVSASERSNAIPLNAAQGAPYSQAVVAGDGGAHPLLFVSGCIGIDPAEGLPGAVVRGGIVAETRQALANLQAILAAAGASPVQLCKVG